MADVAIIGAGSWGIALAKVLHTNGNKVTVWSIVEDEITMLKEKHEHPYSTIAISKRINLGVNGRQ